MANTNPTWPNLDEESRTESKCPPAIQRKTIFDARRKFKQSHLTNLRNVELPKAVREINRKLSNLTHDLQNDYVIFKCQDEFLKDMVAQYYIEAGYDVRGTKIYRDVKFATFYEIEIAL